MVKINKQGERKEPEAERGKEAGVGERRKEREISRTRLQKEKSRPMDLQFGNVKMKGARGGNSEESVSTGSEIFRKEQHNISSRGVEKN